MPTKRETEKPEAAEPTADTVEKPTAKPAPASRTTATTRSDTDGPDTADGAKTASRTAGGARTDATDDQNTDAQELPVSPIADQPRDGTPGDPAHRGGEPRRDADGSVANPPDTAPSPTPVVPGGVLRETGTAI